MDTIHNSSGTYGIIGDIQQVHVDLKVKSQQLWQLLMRKLLILLTDTYMTINT